MLELAWLIVGHYGEYGSSPSNLIIVSLLMGLILPLLANIGPTKNALSRNLRASLDASRSENSGQQVSALIEKLHTLNISLTQIGFSSLLVILGVISIYFLPLAIMNGLLGLFFMITNTILGCIEVGMIFILLLVTPYL